MQAHYGLCDAQNHPPSALVRQPMPGSFLVIQSMCGNRVSMQSWNQANTGSQQWHTLAFGLRVDVDEGLLGQLAFLGQGSLSLLDRPGVAWVHWRGHVPAHGCCGGKFHNVVKSQYGAISSVAYSAPLL